MQMEQLVLPDLRTAEDAADFCNVVRDGLQAQSSTFAHMAPVRQRLIGQLGLRSSASTRGENFEWQDGCELALRAHTAAVNEDAVVVDSASSLLQAAADDTAHVQVRSRRHFELTRNMRGAREGLGAARRLLVRGSAGKSGSTAAKGRNFALSAQAGSVSGKGWNTSDVLISSARIDGRQLPPRVVGTGNVLVGGVLLHQVSICVNASMRLWTSTIVHVLSSACSLACNRVAFLVTIR